VSELRLASQPSQMIFGEGSRHLRELTSLPGEGCPP
jgi:hypothetical protein